jgi:hypothetical protein
MKDIFKVVVNIGTPRGWVEVGCFCLGCDAPAALATFTKLKGNPNAGRPFNLRLDLLKQTDDDSLPELLSSVGCTLNEYAENCRVITRDLFKYLALERQIGHP